jgi:hypothetical protein
MIANRFRERRRETIWESVPFRPLTGGGGNDTESDSRNDSGTDRSSRLRSERAFIGRCRAGTSGSCQRGCQRAGEAS